MSSVLRLALPSSSVSVGLYSLFSALSRSRLCFFTACTPTLALPDSRVWADRTRRTFLGGNIIPFCFFYSTTFHACFIPVLFRGYPQKKVILPLFPVVIFNPPAVFFFSLPDTGFSLTALSLVLVSTELDCKLTTETL
ncbi:hypothetical protein BDW67DRAFT_72451 [Aspergillus spinulosporus]